MYQSNETIPIALKNLSAVSTSLDNSTIDTTLNHQKRLEDIVSKESTRLKTKQHSVELATSSQNRMITLNENYNKQYAEYMKLSIAAACALAIIGIAFFLKLPDNILNIITFITLCILFLFCASIINSINSRDTIYFDELNIIFRPGPQRRNKV